MPIQGILVGRDATAYYNLTLAFDPTDVQTWIDNAQTLVASNIMDLTDNIDSDMADSTTRAEAKAGWSAEIAVLKNGQVQFDFRWEPGDTFTDGLIAAWDSGNGISMLFLDQPGKSSDPVTSPAATAQGLGAIFSVSLSKVENLRDIQKASATLSVAKNPIWAKALGNPGP